MNGLAEVAKQIQEMMLNQLRQQLFGNTETLLVPTVVLTTPPTPLLRQVVGSSSSYAIYEYVTYLVHNSFGCVLLPTG